MLISSVTEMGHEAEVTEQDPYKSIAKSPCPCQKVELRAVPAVGEGGPFIMMAVVLKASSVAGGGIRAGPLRRWLQREQITCFTV